MDHHPSNAHSGNILVAEDDAIMRSLLRTTLERAGYAVREAADGRVALALLDAETPDLALLDIQIPFHDGLDLTRRLRQRPETTLLPIILVTAMGRTEDKVAGLDAGATDFVTKPFEPAELLARVRAGLRLKSALDRLETAQGVLVSLASAIEAKDPAVEHHCSRVAEQAVALARRAGLNPDLVEAIGYGGVLHDVGKIGIPESILRSPARLSEDEWAEMRRHPAIGAAIVEPLRLGRVLGPIVRGHHERWDGHGYPDGLAGERIPVGARIVTVVDAYDAMIHDRPYRAAMSVEQARAELRANAGTQFDPELVALFEEQFGVASVAAVEAADDDFVRGLYRVAASA